MRRGHGAWRRNVVVIATASFVGFTGFTLVMPFLPLYFHELGIEDVGEVALWSGLSLGVTPAMTAMLAPFWGRLADRFGRKIMVERSLVSFIVIMAAMAFVTRPWHIFALRALQGFFAGYGALALTMAADSAPRERTAYAIGLVQTAQRLGPALGPVIGGAVAQLAGLRNAFLITSCFYVVAVLLVFFMFDESSTRPAAGGREERAISFRNVLAFENFILLMGVVFALQFVERTLGPVLPLFVAQLGTPLDRVPLVAGVLFSMGAGSAAVGNQASWRLLHHVPARVLIATSAGIGAVGAATYVLAPSTAWLIAATPLLGVALGAATTGAYTAASSVMPPSARGAAFGLLSTASLIGLAMSPVVAGLLGATSIRAVFLLNVVALAIVGTTVLRTMGVAPLVEARTPVPDEL